MGQGVGVGVAIGDRVGVGRAKGDAVGVEEGISVGARGVRVAVASSAGVWV